MRLAKLKLTFRHFLPLEVRTSQYISLSSYSLRKICSTFNLLTFLFSIDCISIDRDYIVFLLTLLYILLLIHSFIQQILSGPNISDIVVGTRNTTVNKTGGLGFFFFWKGAIYQLIMLKSNTVFSDRIFHLSFSCFILLPLSIHLNVRQWRIDT